jgi:phage shock protein PspC (stress-responsive transcriptional regulator)
MTTSETFSGMQPPSAPTHRLLRRSRTGRVGAGVAAGLGEYFGLDPVLFRVLFATSAFFGGAGILAYLLAWAAIPEEGTESAPIDGWMGALRHRGRPSHWRSRTKRRPTSRPASSRAGCATRAAGSRSRRRPAGNGAGAPCR